jgi:hypothetical protein
MSEAPILSHGELEAFVAEGLVILDRPLTWEIIGELLAALEPGAPNPDN